MARRRQLHRLLATSYQLDVTLENGPQILIQLVIVLLATATFSPASRADTAGLEAVFDTHEGPGVARILFYASIALSLHSILSSLFSTYLFRKEHTVGDLGKLLLYVKIFLEAASRIIALLLSLAPFLGLFNLMLPHQMDSRLAFSPPLEAKYGHVLALSRNLTWYTGGLSLEDYLLLLLTFPVVHIIFLILLKVFLVPQFLTHNLAKIDVVSTVRGLARMVLHACSSLLVPALWRDWDEPQPPGGGGQKLPITRAAFRRSWHQVRREYCALALLHCLENLLLTVPVLVCSYRAAFLRAGQLPSLPEEAHLLTLYYGVLASPVFFLLAALGQIWVFEVYNLKGHPWARLLHVKPDK